MSAPDTNARELPQWYVEHLRGYLQSGGQEGHFFDFGPINGEGYQPICLIRYRGRKTGRTLITPLIYGMVDGEIVIVASNGGSQTHPAWYPNIAITTEVDVQVATQAFRATWREPGEAERQRVWDQMVAIFPPYAEYQNRTERQIPLVLMKPLTAIPVFQESDLDS